MYHRDVVFTYTCTRWLITGADGLQGHQHGSVDGVLSVLQRGNLMFRFYFRIIPTSTSSLHWWHCNRSVSRSLAIIIQITRGPWSWTILLTGSEPSKAKLMPLVTCDRGLHTVVVFVFFFPYFSLDSDCDCLPSWNKTQEIDNELIVLLYFMQLYISYSILDWEPSQFVQTNSLLSLFWLYILPCDFF